jgi:site-specific DNA-methyltransferase (adenine-specific)
MRHIVWAALPLGKGIILDPFMGSGSTIAAARSLGLEGIGLEVDKAFFKAAKGSIPKLARLEVNIWVP